jgi:hypothetical protein
VFDGLALDVLWVLWIRGTGHWILLVVANVRRRTQILQKAHVRGFPQIINLVILFRVKIFLCIYNLMLMRILDIGFTIGDILHLAEIHLAHDQLATTFQLSHIVAKLFQGRGVTIRRQFVHTFNVVGYRHPLKLPHRLLQSLLAFFLQLSHGLHAVVTGDLHFLVDFFQVLLLELFSVL